MPRSKVKPTRTKNGDRAFDFACDCGEGSTPVRTPAEANAQRETHMITKHPEHGR